MRQKCRSLLDWQDHWGTMIVKELTKACEIGVVWNRTTNLWRCVVPWLKIWRSELLFSLHWKDFCTLTAVSYSISNQILKNHFLNERGKKCFSQQQCNFRRDHMLLKTTYFELSCSAGAPAGKEVLCIFGSGSPELWKITTENSGSGNTDIDKNRNVSVLPHTHPVEISLTLLCPWRQQ